MTKYLKVLLIYFASGFVGPLLLSAAAAYFWGEFSLTLPFMYSQLFASVFYGSMSIVPAYLLGCLIRLCLTLVVAGLGRKRFKVGLFIELAFSLLNILAAFWWLLQSMAR